MLSNRGGITMHASRSYIKPDNTLAPGHLVSLRDRYQHQRRIGTQLPLSYILCGWSKDIYSTLIVDKIFALLGLSCDDKEFQLRPDYIGRSPIRLDTLLGSTLPQGRAPQVFLPFAPFLPSWLARREPARSAHLGSIRIRQPALPSRAQTTRHLEAACIWVRPSGPYSD